MYVMINGHERDRTFEIQEWPTASSPTGWRLVTDTSRDSPQDFFEPGREPPVERREYLVRAHSVVVLLRPR